MEIVPDYMYNQLASYIIPVVFVIVVVVLVYTFSFKSPQQPPPFDKLTIDDRKQAGKKKKIKDKKTTANGHVTTGESKHEKSPTKDSKRSPAKDANLVDSQKQKNKNTDNKQLEKNKKNEAIKNNNNINKQQIIDDTKLSKKTIKKLINEKPVDFDDGNWETVVSKSDKKKKPEQSSPIKKEKKSKKTTVTSAIISTDTSANNPTTTTTITVPTTTIEEDKAVEIEKLVKDVVNKELREKEKEVKEEKPVDNNNEIVAIIEKKKEKKTKKENTIEKNIESLAVKTEIEKVISDNNDNDNKKIEDNNKLDTTVITDATTLIVDKEGGVVFDELGDVWTEAKVAKKSKKKARRDN